MHRVFRSPASGPGFVYALYRDSDAMIKIGLSANPFARVKTIRGLASDQDIYLVAMAEMSNMVKAERLLHRYFATFRVDSYILGTEWFKFPLSGAYWALDAISGHRLKLIAE